MGDLKNSLKVAAAFASAVAKGLENLEYNRPISSPIETAGIAADSRGIVDGFCKRDVPTDTIETLNQLVTTQQALADLLESLA